MSKKVKPKEFKAILLGESGTGKTSLINVSVGKKFYEGIPSTLASSFVSKKFEKGEDEYALDLWDTNGQEKYRSMTKLFIKNSKIIIYVYSTDNRNSFENLQYWYETSKEILGDDIVIGVVGNKSDLYLHENVKEIEGKNYADSIGAKFKLVSAKVDPNGFVAFLEDLLNELLEKYGYIPHHKGKEGFEIKKVKKTKTKKSCC